jgi:hypothetical protein
MNEQEDREEILKAVLQQKKEASYIQGELFGQLSSTRDAPSVHSFPLVVLLLELRYHSSSGFSEVFRKW